MCKENSSGVRTQRSMVSYRTTKDPTDPNQCLERTWHHPRRSAVPFLLLASEILDILALQQTHINIFTLWCPLSPLLGFAGSVYISLEEEPCGSGYFSIFLFWLLDLDIIQLILVVWFRGIVEVKVATESSSNLGPRSLLADPATEIGEPM